MSIIPSTFNEDLPLYAVVGGKERLASTGISVILLNRGGQYSRKNLFSDFKKAGFDTVISVEPQPIPYDIEALSNSFPFVSFMLLQQPFSIGEQINMAASEIKTPLFFVLWNDLKIITGGNAERLALRLINYHDNTTEIKRLCTVPVIQNSRFETLPTIIMPELRRNKIKTILLGSPDEGLPSIYPFDGIGIYDRERFLKLGGYDGEYRKSRWQFLDFGFRSYLWGEKIAATAIIKLLYEEETTPDEVSADNDYCRFYLRNLAPVYNNNSAYLPLRRFPGFLFKAKSKISAAWEIFNYHRSWVNEYSLRWQHNLKTVAGFWKNKPLKTEK